MKKRIIKSQYDLLNSPQGHSSFVNDLRKNHVEVKVHTDNKFICFTHTPSGISVSFDNSPIIKTAYYKYMLEKLLEKVKESKLN